MLAGACHAHLLEARQRLRETSVGLAPAPLPSEKVGLTDLVAGQLGTGWLSDHAGRKPLIVIGMLVQAAGLVALVAGGGALRPALLGAVLLGVGTALVYPTLIAAVSDAVAPRERAQAVGVYRFWRDIGLVAGALLAGAVADAAGAGTAISLVAGLTAASGLWVAATRWQAAATARPLAPPVQ